MTKRLGVSTQRHTSHPDPINTVCNYSTIIYTMLLLRSLKDNYKKITLSSIVVLMVKWIRNSPFNQESGVRVPAGALYHNSSLKILEYETECCGRKESK